MRGGVGAVHGQQARRAARQYLEQDVSPCATGGRVPTALPAEPDNEDG